MRATPTLVCESVEVATGNSPAGGALGRRQVCLTANDRACVLDAGGTATCWGAEPMQPPDETFSKLACGDESVCGLTDDGRIVCWGDCDNGECDVPTDE